MQVGETFIKVRPDTRGFGGELQGSVQQEASGLGTEMGNAITRQLGAVLAGGAAVSFLRDSVGAASDLNEAVSLTQNTFQEAADGVLEMGENSAESLGLANDEALSFANSIGGLFIGFGETRAEAAAMSEDVISLGADLASAKNLAGGTGEALEILRSGLVGEVEPLRRIGVALNAASVEQRALADTGKESAAQLTEGEKAAARYALIFESLSAQGVVGDFARTQDQAANQQRIFQAELRNTQAEVGQRLLPAFINLIGAARDGLPLLTLVGEGLSTSAEGASLLAAVLGPLASTLIDVNDGLERTTGGIVNLTSLDFSGIGSITTIFRAAQEVFGSDVGDEAESTVEQIVAAAERLGIDATGDLETWTNAVADFATGRGLSFREALAELGLHGDLAASVLAELSVQGLGAGAAFGEVGAGIEAANDAASRTDLDAQAEALAEIAQAAEDAIDQLEALYGIQQSLDEATLGTAEAQDAFTASVLENGRTFDINTEAGRANLENARQLATSIRDQTIAYRANGASVAEADQSQRFYIQSLRDQLLASGLSRGETERLIDTYARVPRQVLTKLDADDGPARAGVDSAVGYALGQWAGRSFTATLGISTGAVAGQIGALQAQIDRLDESAAAPGPTVIVQATAPNYLGDPAEIVDVIAGPVAAAIDEHLRRS